MRRAIFAAAVMALGVWTGAVLATEKPITLIACVSDVAVPPLTYPDREGLLQYLARHAADAIGVQMEFVVEPRKRCLDSVTRGKYQLLLVTADTPSLQAQFAFPVRGGTVDKRRAAGPPQKAMLISLSNSSVRWDGAVLSGLHEPLLVKSGNVVLIDWLKKRQLPYIEVRTQQQIVAMLQSGRAESAILRDEDLRDVRANLPAHVGIVMHPVPVLKADMYITANMEFARKNQALMDRFWNEIARLQTSPDWKAKEPGFF